MASFPPFKAHILSLFDELADQHGLSGPFLDAGCGTGDVAAHLAARGWSGVALDLSADATAMAAEALRDLPEVEVVHDTLERYCGGPFPTVVMFDVIEHIALDEAALHAIAELQAPGGMLVMTVPTHQRREWRWDDDMYGHLRRYAPGAIVAQLHRAGYEVVEMWDITFPVLWFLRRAYTALKRPPALTGTAAERTTRSSTARSWDMGPISAILSLKKPWLPIFALQNRFRRNVDRGHEVIVLARRTDHQRVSGGRTAT